MTKKEIKKIVQDLPLKDVMPDEWIERITTNLLPKLVGKKPNIGNETKYGFIVDWAKVSDKFLVCVGPELEFLAPWDNAKELVSAVLFHGFEGWFIPRKDQLDLMYTRLYRVGLGDFDDSIYLSSSEDSSSYAWGQDFGSGYQNFYNKYNNIRVRAVRWFSKEELQ